MKTLLPVLLVLLYVSNTMADLFEVKQVTLKGEYFDPAGHPGIPYEPEPGDFTIGEEVVLGDFLDTYSLYLQTENGPVLLDRYAYPGTPYPSAYTWITDYDRIAWTRLPVMSGNSYGVYVQGEAHTFPLIPGSTFSFSPYMAFGPHFFVASDGVGLITFDPDPASTINLLSMGIVFLDSMHQWVNDWLLLDNTVSGYAAPHSAMSITTYANGIDIAQDWVYSLDADAPIYTEHFWIQVPEPTTLLLLGLGGLLRFCHRKVAQ